MKTIAEKVQEARHLTERFNCGGYTWCFTLVDGSWTKALPDGNILKIRAVNTHALPWVPVRVNTGAGTSQGIGARGFKTMEHAAKAALKHWGYVS